MFSKLRALLTNSHMGKFIIVGMSNTAASYAIFVILLLLTNNYILSATLSYLIVLIKSFYFNKSWVFKSNKQVNLKLTLYFLFINLLSLTSNLIILTFLIEVTNVNVYISQAIATLIIMGINYNGYKLIFSTTK